MGFVDTQHLNQQHYYQTQLSWQTKFEELTTSIIKEDGAHKMELVCHKIP